MMLRLAWVLVVALLLSGCVGETEDLPTGTSGNGTGPDPTGADDGPAFEILRPPLDTPTRATLWRNDSFAPTDACNAGGCQTGDFQRVIDITQQVPTDVPTRIEAALEYESDPITIGPMRVYLYAEDATIYHYTETRSSGTSSFDVTLAQRTGTLAIVVEYYFPRNSDTEAPYSLRATIAADNASIPPQVPVAVTLETGQWLRMEHLGDDPTTVSVYGPDDTYLGSHSVGKDGRDLQADKAGAYVLIAAPDGPVQYSTNGTPEPLRSLGLVAEFAETRPPDAAAPTEWTIDLDTRPLAAGVYLKSTDTHGAHTHVLDETLRLDGPEGTLVESTYQCTVCLNIMPDAVVFTAGTALGDPRLIPGTYTGHYDWQGSWGLTVGHYTVHYAR